MDWLPAALEWLPALTVGLALSAVCGLRVFVPPLLLSLAAGLNWLELPTDMAWLARPEATGTLAAATLLEVGAYSIPWLDNLLDALATPLAIVAGTLVTAAHLFEIPGIAEGDPAVGWVLAALSGGTVAAIVQLATVVVRGLVGTLSGGLLNFIVAFVELVGAVFFGILALLVPVLSGTLLITAALIVLLMLRKRLRERRQRRELTAEPAEVTAEPPQTETPGASPS